VHAKLTRMKTIDSERLALAERFVWSSARVLERRRFERLFRAGAAAPVLTALRAYQNADGGFGHAIEPDFRGPISQPLGADIALRLLEELGEHDSAIVDGVVSFVIANTTADGGVPNVLPSAKAFPRAPWWEPASDDPDGSLYPTASLAGVLHALRIEHRWLEGADRFCWDALGRLLEQAGQATERVQRIGVAYQARAALVFLDRVADRARAEQAAVDLGRALSSAGLISASESAETAPLTFAHAPDTLARRWFDDALIEKQLDDLIAAQAADGGWTVPWPIWAPVTELEWRGVLTVESLKTLRAYGRLTTR